MIMMQHVAGIAADADTMTEAVIYFETPEWVALLEWLEFHGIDPMLVPARSRVVRDERNRCIWYVGIVLDERGRRRQKGLDAGPGESMGGLVTQAMVEQGEASPLPYPDVIQALLKGVPR